MLKYKDYNSVSVCTCRDKAELSEEVGGFTKKVTEDYENLDKISIQADMWRSKFLASRWDSHIVTSLVYILTVKHSINL